MLKSTYSVTFKQPPLCFVSSDTRTDDNLPHSLIFSSDRQRRRWNTGTHHSDKVSTVSCDCMIHCCCWLLTVYVMVFPQFCCLNFSVLPLDWNISILQNRIFPLVCLSYIFPTVFNASKADAVWSDQNYPKQRNAKCQIVESWVFCIVWRLGECLERPLPKMCWVGCKRVVVGRAGREGWAQGATGGEGGC